MRILVHDFGGYAFVLQLSKALAKRGHTVRHVYCASLTTTPPGVTDEVAAKLDIHGIRLGSSINKYAFVQRWWQEEQYGRMVAQDCVAFNPDVVLSGNTPLSSQRHLVRACRRRGIRFVFWVQDFLGLATRTILARMSRPLGVLVGGYFTRLEGRLLRKSDAVITISQDFSDTLRRMRVDENHVTVIENWGCLEDLPVRPRKNRWATRHGLTQGTCFLYSGTLSMKHNPDMLLQLAIRMRSYPHVRVIVVSQGSGADWLSSKKAQYNLDRLIILPYQTKKELADMYATADILVAVLDEAAGMFSVPSKVAAYMCSERPLLLAIPQDNLAARVVSDSGAGVVVSPADQAGFLDAAEHLLVNPEARRQMGVAARAYAEKAFAIEPVADRFASVLLPYS